MYMSTYCSCTDSSEPSSGCWELNLGLLLALGQPCSLRPKDLFILIRKHTVADFRCTRRGRQISLWVVVSHYVVAGI